MSDIKYLDIREEAISRVKKELKFHHRAAIDLVYGMDLGDETFYTYPNTFSTGDNADDRTLVNVGKGNSGYQREGRSIMVQSLQLTAFIYQPLLSDFNDNAGTDSTMCPLNNAAHSVRLIVFIDKQCNKFGCNALADVIDKEAWTHPGTNVDLTRKSLIYGEQNLYNEDRFEILCDEKLTTTINTLNNLVPTISPIVIKKEWKMNLPIQFEDPDGTGSGKVENIKSNNIQFALAGSWDSNVIPGPEKVMVVKYAWEIRYYDD